MVDNSSANIGQWTYQDGGGPKAIAQVQVMFGQVILTLDGVTTTGPGYEVAYTAPPYDIRATDGTRLLSGSWSAAIEVA